MNDPGLIRNDPWLEPYRAAIVRRMEKAITREGELTGEASLHSFASGHLWFGLHGKDQGWVMREWAPNATEIFLIGTFNNWQVSDKYRFDRLDHGNWEIRLNKGTVAHGDRYKLLVRWEGGEGERIPAWCNRVVQDPKTHVFDAQVWIPPKPYKWKNPLPDLKDFQPLIYEGHIGMATEEYRVGSYTEFREKVLPRVVRGGYNTLQLMAIQEHPYYGSFGYHVSNFFAASSRFGTPEELKELIDEAHGHGVAVIMDIVHSHAVKNENEGLGKLDGNPAQFFHGNYRREHVAWDSLCFDYGKNEVTHFLLSNVNYWLSEYRFDGFRFDGVTSMLYYDHGLERDFTSYDFYFDGGQDEDAIAYLSLANKMIQEIRPGALSIAEDMSGYPGLAVPVDQGGVGFSYRLAMGTPDYWIKTIKEKQDEQWNVSEIFHELTSKRADEKTVGYAESHDQALVGDKTIIFRLIDKEMYWHMDKGSQNLVVDRGIALHKMIRLITAATAGNAYLNFMGNEFGHPEWIDFPREGNDWSYQYARRQWSLVENQELRYHHLGDFDMEMIRTIGKFNIYSGYCMHVKTDQADLVIAFERHGLLFVFNFHPNNSYTDYGLAVDAGKYTTLLSSDQPEFGGFGRYDTAVVHRTQVELSFGLKQNLKLYLPSRTAIVLQRGEIPRVR
ncbi:MAG: alpha amylase C-terminal domain-containing protein [Bacteroidales bacterium]|nr:alpha amylase C-terminal domain-containing protein [Bacteroidales bacterium]